MSFEAQEYASNKIIILKKLLDISHNNNELIGWENIKRSMMRLIA